MSNLGRRTLALYALPALGVAGPSFFVQFYFLSFATDSLLLAPATVGALLAAGRLWDALSDPLAGYGSDRTRSRWGRRRPWLAVAAPASALAFLALWHPPSGWSDPLRLTLWSAGALWLFTTASTAWAIPHQALGAELSDDPDTRTRVFGWRFLVAMWGVALCFAAMQGVGNAEDPRAAARTLAAAVAVGMLLLLWVPVLGLRERPELWRTPVGSPWRATRELLARPAARRLLGVSFVVQFGSSTQGVIAPYVSTYVVQRPDLMGVMPALFVGPLMLSVPLWVRWARLHGRKRVWGLSMLGASGAYALLFFAPLDDFRVTALLLATAGFFTGSSGPIAPSFFADLVDAEARRSGERREGTTFAAKEFVEKASSAAVALALGLVLQSVGFEPNVAQSETAKLAIQACLGLLPGLLLLLGAGWLRGLDIDGEGGSGAPARMAELPS